CPTPGRSHRPSAPAGKTGLMLLSPSVDTDQLMPSLDVANPMAALFAPEVMLNHIRYTGESSTTVGLATVTSPPFEITVPRSLHWIPWDEVAKPMPPSFRLYHIMNVPFVLITLPGM